MQSFNYDAVKDLVRCPKTRAPLVFTGEALVSCDPETRLSYPIVDGFPILLIEEATPLPHEEWSGIMSRCGFDPATGEEREHRAPAD
jgi:uncharacterized protein YbaR (Trm112 family)